MKPWPKAPLRDPNVEDAFATACVGVPRVSAGTEDVDCETEQRGAKDDHGSEAQAPTKTAADLAREMRHILAEMNWRPSPLGPLPEKILAYYATLIEAARAREAAEAAHRDHEDLDVPSWSDLGPSPS